MWEPYTSCWCCVASSRVRTEYEQLVLCCVISCENRIHEQLVLCGIISCENHIQAAGDVWRHRVWEPYTSSWYCVVSSRVITVWAAGAVWYHLVWEQYELLVLCGVTRCENRMQAAGALWYHLVWEQYELLGLLVPSRVRTVQAAGAVEVFVLVLRPKSDLLQLAVAGHSVGWSISYPAVRTHAAFASKLKTTTQGLQIYMCVNELTKIKQKICAQHMRFLIEE